MPISGVRRAFRVLEHRVYVRRKGGGGIRAEVHGLLFGAVREA